MEIFSLFSLTVRALIGTRGGDVIEMKISDGGILKNKPLATGHYFGELWGLASHPKDPNLFVTCGDDKTVRMWHIERISCIAITDPGSIPEICRTIAYTPAPGHEGEYLALGLGGRLAGVNGETGDSEHAGKIMILDGENLEVMQSLKVADSMISDLAFSSDGRRLAVASADTNIYLLSVDGPMHIELCHKCVGHSNYVTSITLSHDVKFMLSNDSAGNMKYWNIENGTEETNIGEDISSIRDSDWRVNTCALSWSTQGIWPSKNGKLADINSIVEKDGMIITGDDFGMVNLFNSPSLQWCAPKMLHNGHSAHVTKLCFNANNSRVISIGGADRCAFVWRVVTLNTEEQASVTIQRLSRGYLLRKEAAAKSLEVEDKLTAIREAEEMENRKIVEERRKAAEKIQKIQRGKSAREAAERRAWKTEKARKKREEQEEQKIESTTEKKTKEQTVNNEVLNSKTAKRLTALFEEYGPTGHMNTAALSLLLNKCIECGGGTKYTFQNNEVDNVMLAFDIDGNGTVEKDEFLNWISDGMSASPADRRSLMKKSTLGPKLNAFLDSIVTILSDESIDFKNVKSRAEAAKKIQKVQRGKRGREKARIAAAEKAEKAEQGIIENDKKKAETSNHTFKVGNLVDYSRSKGHQRAQVQEIHYDDTDTDHSGSVHGYTILLIEKHKTKFTTAEFVFAPLEGDDFVGDEFEDEENKKLESVAGTRCVANHSYEGHEADDLKFAKGEVIIATDTSDDGWWVGHLSSDASKVSGHFPANFVAVQTVAESMFSGTNHSLTAPVENGKRCVANHSYDGDEADDLSFKKGAVIIATDTSDDGWWVGYLSSDASKVSGHFPSNFVALQTVAESLFNAVPYKGTKCIANHAYKGESPDDLSFKKGAVIIATDTSDDGWWIGYLSSDASKVSGHFPSNFVEKQD